MKAAIVAFTLLTAAVCSGASVGALYLRGERKSTLVGGHLLVGATGMELTVVMLRGAPDGEVVAATTIGVATTALLATAMASGFATPLLGKCSNRGAQSAVSGHVALGLAGYGSFLYWLLNPKVVAVSASRATTTDLPLSAALRESRFGARHR